ncbi:unnamed protein product [Cyprideis torosa]|uniref:oxaloacetate tautomerase n=1 Tax=Cyprideis torosa TaxID=163714 RepID=A0A7R8WEX4_9CRUS|nr:unnamed protein product [Cyprideis torosa]CAG0896309.1 unnamed protein product [Cyprideis torosa]
MTHEIPVQPLIFLKPTSSYVTEGNPIIIPSGCKNLHHEVELGLVIGDSKPAPLGAINNDNYREFIAGYVLALDMTARDFQETAKKAGHPWALAKAFDTSCAVGDLILTGTPSGVGQVKAGDVITGSLRDIKDESKVRDSEVA